MYNTKTKTFLQRTVAYAILVAMLTMFIPLVQAAGPALFVEDTVAGMGTHVYINDIINDGDTSLVLHKPDGTKIYYDNLTSTNGSIDLEIHSYHTQAAGTYSVDGRVGGQYVSQKFEVFADAPSDMYSTVKSNKSIIKAGGKEAAHVVVTLLDEYKNPVTDHHVRLVSSRESDHVEALDDHPFTNDDGQVVFKITSSSAGTSTLTALNATTNVVMGQRESILFIDGNGTAPTDTAQTVSALNTETLQSSLLAQASSSGTDKVASTLRLTASKNTVAPGEPFDLTVEVLTSKGMPATDYRGKILFLSDDPNAELPLTDAGYTFTGAEQPAGERTFSKATKFLTEGTKTIEVVDIDDPSLKDSVEITVSNGGSTATDASIQITRPEAGILTSKDVAVEGKAEAFANLRIYDKGVEISEATADAAGNFSVTLSSLIDGTHIFEVRQVSSSGETLARSEQVQITLKASGPTATNVAFNPTKAEYIGGEKVQVTFSSEADLSKASSVVDGTTFPMTQSSSVKGSYSGNVILPKAKGTYDLTLQLESKLAATGETTLSKAFAVGDPLFDFTTLTYTLQDGGAVKATWKNTTTAQGVSYSIAYGTSETNLDQTATIDSSQSTATIQDLQGGSTYYFQFQVAQNGATIMQDTSRPIVIPDLLGFGNAQALPTDTGKFNVSWIIKGDSTKVSQVRVLYGISTGNYIREQVVNKDTNNIELDQLVERSRHYFKLELLDSQGKAIAKSDEFSSVVETFHSSATCTPGDVTGLRVTVANGKRYLEWNAVTGAEGYRVYQGASESSYGDPEVVTDANYPLPNMSKEDAPKYFAVTAYCGDKESKNFSNAIKVESGPVAMLFFLIAVGFAGYATYRRKQRVI